MALALYVTAVLTSGPLKGALSAFDPGARALASAPPAQQCACARACSLCLRASKLGTGLEPALWALALLSA